MDVSQKVSCIINIMVIEEHRRKGIGSQILLALSEVAEAYGCKRIKLRVRISNTPALSLYMMFGFVKNRVITNYYSDGENALLMSAALPLKIPDDGNA